MAKAKKIDTALNTIEKKNPSLKGALLDEINNIQTNADKEIGLLVNFGCNSLKWERISKFENMGMSNKYMSLPCSTRQSIAL